MEQEGDMRDEVVRYLLGGFDGGPRRTLRDLYQERPRYPWGDFVRAVNHMVSEGLLEYRGNGFEVLYALTSKGLTTARAYNSGRSVE
jgi:hypothetical protein